MISTSPLTPSVTGTSSEQRPSTVPFHVVIPARHASTRLPGKPLLAIGGKPMVIHVAEQALNSGAREVWIATDHDEIEATVRQYGFNVCMTDAAHNSGTDRIAEVVTQRKWPDEAIVVNVQGDEPFIPPDLITAVASHLHSHPECAIATACHAIHDDEAMRNPNIVKVVLDINGNALYFSRAPIPWPRDAYARNQSFPSELPVFRHIGIYAYRVAFLHAYGQLASPQIEQYEALEQLRAIYHGYKIGVHIARHAPPGGVDTDADLLAARQVVESRSKIMEREK